MTSLGTTHLYAERSGSSLLSLQKFARIKVVIISWIGNVNKPYRAVQFWTEYPIIMSKLACHRGLNVRWEWGDWESASGSPRPGEHRQNPARAPFCILWLRIPVVGSFWKGSEMHTSRLLQKTQALCSSLTHKPSKTLKADLAWHRERRHVSAKMDEKIPSAAGDWDPSPGEIILSLFPFPLTFSVLSKAKWVRKKVND